MGLFDIFRKKKKTEVVEQNESDITDMTIVPSSEITSSDDALAVVVEELTAVQVNEASLIEITDRSILARIDGLVPSVVSTAATAVARNVCANSEPLYRVILKNGGQLVDSRTMAGAKRAMTIGADGIRENANLVQVQANGLTKAGTVATVGANVMNVASMVVGQYYMQQVDSKIKLLQAGVETIMDFLDIQYKSQVVALLESVFSITKFQIASLENEELRNRELDNIQHYRFKCLELLSQAEDHLQKLISTDSKDYSAYVKTIKSVEKWIKFQQILLQLLNQISILDYTLHLGVKSKEQCFDNLLTHTNKANKSRESLIAWHEKQCTVLRIDLVDKRRKNTGFWALLEKPISFINDEWNYHSVDDSTIALIQGQSQIATEIPLLESNPFEEDVQIIIIGDKKYYLPKSDS